MSRVAVKLEDAGITYRVKTGFFSYRFFIALYDLNFEIYKGETLGVMGANGSGKSTLLRLLARIYRPDSGRVEYFVDRISLLTLALGLDSELSGADNAILSSMLFGATFAEANERLEQILEFAGLGEFAHHAVKTYSSGMRSRLGFSVALHMKTDLLLIDEVLAVGDAEFKNKSEEAIRRRITSDQTVVLVSHSPQQIAGLCDRALLLHEGRIMKIGDPKQIAELYQAIGTSGS